MMIKKLGVMLVVFLIAGCVSPKTLNPPTSTRDKSAASVDFSVAGASSGCPSPECSDILAQVAAGAKTDTVPAGLTPKLADSQYDLKLPDDRQCTTLPLPNLIDESQPCIYPTGAKPDAPLIAVIGDSVAWMWSTAVAKMATQLGYRAAGIVRAGCSMPDATFPTSIQGYTDQDCRAWKDAAIAWVNSLNPAVVLVATAVSRAISAEDFGQAYVPTIKKLEVPGRKVFVMGNVPNLSQDPPRCLGGHTDSALKCATPIAKAAPTDEQQAVFDASQQAGAGYVNLTPLACTDVCPAIIGNYAAYQDTYHFSSTYARALVPVIIRALGLTPVTAP